MKQGTRQNTYVWASKHAAWLGAGVQSRYQETLHPLLVRGMHGTGTTWESSDGPSLALHSDLASIPGSLPPQLPQGIFAHQVMSSSGAEAKRCESWSSGSENTFPADPSLYPRSE